MCAVRGLIHVCVSAYIYIHMHVLLILGWTLMVKGISALVNIKSLSIITAPGSKIRNSHLLSNS